MLQSDVRIGRWSALAALLACGLLAAAPVRAQAAAPSLEHRVKAGFLLNFARFVEWPAAAFAAADSPLCIGVLGEDPFGAFLDETVRGEAIRGHGVIVRRAHTAEALRGCQVVFIARSEVGSLQRHLTALSGQPVLTVGETAGFAQRGGIVNFYLERERVRFEINRAGSERAGLRLDPQLLRLARAVSS